MLRYETITSLLYGISLFIDIFSLMGVKKCVHVTYIFAENGEITLWEIIIPPYLSFGVIFVL